MSYHLLLSLPTTVPVAKAIQLINDFDRPSGTGVFLYRYPGTSYLATIVLSLRDKIHSLAEALLELTLMG
jgi:hypothetical protein